MSTTDQDTKPKPDRRFEAEIVLPSGRVLKGERSLFPLEVPGGPDGRAYRGNPHITAEEYRARYLDPKRPNLVQRARAQRLVAGKPVDATPLTAEECAELADLRSFLEEFPSSHAVLRASAEDRERLAQFYEACEPRQRLADYAAHVAYLAQSFLSATKPRRRPAPASNLQPKESE